MVLRVRRFAPTILAGTLAIVPLHDGLAGHDRDAAQARTLADYRYFRALSIDLMGRPPSDEELAAFEQPGFETNQWIDAHLSGAAYAERLRRVYMDAMRLEAGATYHFMPGQIALVRQTVTGPNGEPMYIYFRHGQRRTDPVTDGEFCLSRAETGYDAPSRTVHGGVAKRISQSVLDAKTILVKPWWHYADYRSPHPAQVLGPDWATRFGFELGKPLLVGADGHTPETEIRVCKEEAQTAETGAIFTTGFGTGKHQQPEGRVTPPIADTVLARHATGHLVSCATATGFRNSAQCGCGVGLERCVPGDSGFIMPVKAPLGPEQPFLAGQQPAGEWIKLWWAQEAAHFLDQIFEDDRDFRDVLLARWTEINGPLGLFYRSLASMTCCGPGAEIGYLQPDQLFRSDAVPDHLPAVDTRTWVRVADRGAHAAGVMTMPVFLTKYGSRRARAHVLYNTFLCRDFVASKVRLEPSTEPDLTKRPGCSTCHRTLEPMAAYFTRVLESDWTWLPESVFPARGCPDKPREETCYHVYDRAFNVLAGAYASTAHADAGPSALARDITGSPEFAPCVVQNVAQSFLGRPLTPEEAEWKQQLVKTFVKGGYRMRALVQAIVTSPAYRSVYIGPQGGR